MKSLILIKKMKSLYECFNGVKETKKSSEMLPKMLLFLEN